MPSERLDVIVRLRGLRQFLSSASRAGLAASGIGSAWMVMSRRMTVSQGLMIRGFSVLHRQLRGLSVIAGVAGFALGKEILDFEGQMKRVESVTASSSGKFAVSYEKLTAGAIDAASQTKYSNTEAAEALYILAAAGFEAKDAHESLLGTLRLAQAVGTDTKSAALLQTAALNSFTDAGYDATKVADIMTRAVNRSALSADNLTQSFKYVAQPAAQLGFSLEDTTAALMTLAQVGIRGSTAGTSLRFGMKSLISPVGQAKTALKEMNLQIEDFQTAEGKMKTFPKVLETIRDATKDMTHVERQATIGRLVGVRAMNSWTALVEHPEKYDLMNKRVRAAGLTAESTGKKMQENMGAALENMGNQISGFFIKFIFRYSARIQLFFRRIGQSFENFGNSIPKIEAFLKPFWEAFAAGLSLLWTIGKDALVVVAIALVAIRTILPPLTAGIEFINEHWDAFRIVLLTLGGIMLVFYAVRLFKTAKMLYETARAAFLVTKMLWATQGPMRALSIMLFNSPWGIWIVAIGALIGGLIILYTKWKPFHDFVNDHKILVGFFTTVLVGLTAAMMVNRLATLANIKTAIWFRATMLKEAAAAGILRIRLMAMTVATKATAAGKALLRGAIFLLEIRWIALAKSMLFASKMYARAAIDIARTRIKIIALRVALWAKMVAMRAAILWTIIYTKGLWLLTVASSKLYTALLRLRIAMLANPVGFIVLGLLILIAVFVLLYQRFEWFRNGVHAVINFVKDHWRDFVRYFTFIVLGPFALGIATAIRIWDPIKQAFQDFWDLIHGDWSKIGDLLAAPFKIAWAIIEPIVGPMMDIIGKVGDFLGNFGFGGSSGVGQQRLQESIAMWQGLVPQAAAGGIVSMGGTMLVGENGPELARFPRGARIDPLPAPDFEGVDLSSTFEGVSQIHLYIDGKEVAQANHRHVQKKAARR